MRRTHAGRILLVVGAALTTMGLLLVVTGRTWLGLAALVAGVVDVAYALLRQKPDREG